MNKTIIINISGTIFHIEEDAYDVLRNYMTDVKRYFGNSSDSFEIVTDIENRVAELFTEILKTNSSQVIVTANVQQVIAQMGRTEDFEAEPGKDTDTPEEKQPVSRRKLYRDGEDKVLGGVCSGLGYFFGAEAVWVRVIFAVLLFAGGFAAIAYIILWIAMPVARTRSERLAMAGEKVNLETLRNSVQNELGEVQQRFKKYGTDLRSGAAAGRIGDFIEEFFSLAGGVFGVIGKILLFLIGFLAIVVGIAIFISAIGFLVFFLFIPENEHFNAPFYLDLSPVSMSLAGIAGMLAIGIPALFLIVVGIRLLVRRTIMNGLVARTLLVLWFFALIGCVFTGVSVARRFAEEASINQEVVLKPVASNTYYLKPGGPTDETDSAFSGDLAKGKHRNWHIKIYKENFTTHVDMEVRKQDTGRAVIEEVFSSRGRDAHDALRHADKIRYQFIQKDSVLTFPESISWSRDTYRDQKAKIILRVPVGTILVADPESNMFDLPDLNDYEKVEGKNNIFVMTDSGLKPKYLKHKPVDEEDAISLPPPPPKAPGRHHADENNTDSETDTDSGN